MILLRSSACDRTDLMSISGSNTIAWRCRLGLPFFRTMQLMLACILMSHFKGSMTTSINDSSNDDIFEISQLTCSIWYVSVLYQDLPAGLKYSIKLIGLEIFFFQAGGISMSK